MKNNQESANTFTKLAPVIIAAGTLALGPNVASAEQSSDQTTTSSPELRHAKRAVKKASRAAIEHYTDDFLTEESQIGVKTKLEDGVFTMTVPPREGVPRLAFVYRLDGSTVTVYEGTRSDLNSAKPTNAVSMLVDLPNNKNIIKGKLKTGQEVNGSDIASVLNHDGNFLMQTSVRTDASSKVRTVIFRHNRAPLFNEVQSSLGVAQLATVPELLETADAVTYADTILTAQPEV